MRSVRFGIVASVLGFGAAACVGGGGAVGNPPDAYDPAPTSGERPPSSTDRPSSGNDSAGSSGSSGSMTGSSGGTSGSSGGSSGFACSGTYSCSFSIQGQTQSVPLSLSKSGNDCTASTGQEPLTLASDGKVLQKGQAVGTWSQAGDGFTINAEGVVLTCKR